MIIKISNNLYKVYIDLPYAIKVFNKNTNCVEVAVFYHSYFCALPQVILSLRSK